MIHVGCILAGSNGLCVGYNGESDPDDPAHCRCRCSCGRRVDSFSSVGSGETLVGQIVGTIIPKKECGSGTVATIDEMPISPC